MSVHWHVRSMSWYLHFYICREWPTIPQLYVGGEFVGGCDILISSMFSTHFRFILIVC